MNELSSTMFFDGFTPILRTIILGVFAYVALVALLRTSGKRTLSKMNAFDFVVTVAFGSTLAAILTSNRVSLAQGIVALALLIGLQFVTTTIAVRWPWFRKAITAQPTLVFFKGEYLPNAMRSQRLTDGEVIAAIRRHGFAQPEKVDAVIIEADGSFSVLSDENATAEALSSLGVEVENRNGIPVETVRES